MTSRVYPFPFFISYNFNCIRTNPGTEVITKISCSIQLNKRFFLLLDVKIPRIVGILTFVSRKNNILCLSEPENAEFLDTFILMSI